MKTSKLMNNKKCGANGFRQILASITIALASLPASAGQIAGKVVSVADGDTVTVLDANNQQHKIRLSGIDAPERAQPFGRQAREHLANLIAGEQVAVETSKTDRYGRSIGKVLAQNRDINLAMVAAGLAWHYKLYENEQPTADRPLYSSAEEMARAQRLGLWRDPQPVAPWTWRSMK